MTNDFENFDQPVEGQEQSQQNTGFNNMPQGGQNPPARSSLRFGPTGNSTAQPSQASPQPQAVQPEDGAYRYTYPAGSQPGTGYYGGSVYSSTQPPQPQPTYRPEPAYTRTEPTMAETAAKKKKKKSNAGPIVATALICLILGLGVGGGAMWLLNRDTKSETAPEDVTPEVIEETIGAEASQQEPTAFQSTTIDITTNSEATSMTPQNVYEHYVNAVVAIANEGTSTNIFGQVSATASTGSGMIISADGYILTNNHVVEGAEKLTVTMTSGEEYEATLIAADSDNDVALIKIDGQDFPTVSIGNSDEIQVGEQVCAIGNPLGELTNTMTVGYVSALDREINEDGIPINMFQTDCAINSGNSGGPIFDMNGNVVGITTAKYSSSALTSSASIEGIGFCIPINDAMSIVDDLLQYGYVKGRVSMGIMCQAISSTVTQYYNLPAGIYVASVEEDSAADNAGIQESDIICAIDGVEVTSVTELKVKLKEYKPGDTATLTIYRNETHETEDVSITFDEMVATSNTQASTGEQETQDQQPQQDQQEQQIPFFPFG